MELFTQKTGRHQYEKPGKRITQFAERSPSLNEMDAVANRGFIIDLIFGVEAFDFEKEIPK
jgi:hypothetical protein